MNLDSTLSVAVSLLAACGPPCELVPGPRRVFQLKMVRDEAAGGVPTYVVGAETGEVDGLVAGALRFIIDPMPPSLWATIFHVENNTDNNGKQVLHDLTNDVVEDFRGMKWRGQWRIVFTNTITADAPIGFQVVGSFTTPGTCKPTN
jgi:hypothetical protein